MMGDVFVPYGDSAGDTATLLLAEADNKDLDPAVVRSVEGGFLVDEELAKGAGVEYDTDEPEQEPDEEPESDDESDEKPADEAANESSK